MTRLSPPEALTAYCGRRVLVTGHTGFKGSWLTIWLAALGADVSGFALAPDQGPDNLFDRAKVEHSCRSRIGDIRDFAAVEAAVADANPEIVFHLAAQPLVQRSYGNPIDTFATNVLGTAHVLEASRRWSGVRAVVCVTTDKVYRNREWAWPYRECDELGGFDPYSASKAAAELIARCYRTALAPNDRPFAMATVRGGNVLGGGDWSPDRLVPDMVRALRARQPLEIRNPEATRPWSHVLDLCYAYLLIGAVLAERADGAEIDAWNIGPAAGIPITVRTLVDLFFSSQGAKDHAVVLRPSSNFESRELILDSSLARARLGWSPMLEPKETIRLTSDWYSAYEADPGSARALVEEQRTSFERRLSVER